MISTSAWIELLSPDSPSSSCLTTGSGSCGVRERIHKYACDTLFGGAGDDWLIADDGAIDQLFGNTGTDYADGDEDDLLTSIESTA